MTLMSIVANVQATPIYLNCVSTTNTQHSYEISFDEAKQQVSYMGIPARTVLINKDSVSFQVENAAGSISGYINRKNGSMIGVGKSSDSENSIRLQCSKVANNGF